MNRILILCMALLSISQAYSQKTFVGVVKYKITVEGSTENKTDSMMLVFDTNRVKIVMYLPDLKSMWYAEEREFVDDFIANRSYKLSPDKKVETDSLKSSSIYVFRNTNRYGSVNNRLGFVYEVDPKTLSGQDIRKVQCVSSLEYFYPVRPDYAFLGYQPVVVDGRLVLDYTITQANGNRPRVYADQVIPMDNVARYFSDFNLTQRP